MIATFSEREGCNTLVNQRHSLFWLPLANIANGDKEVQPSSEKMSNPPEPPPLPKFTMQSGGSSIEITPTNCDTIKTLGCGSYGNVLKVQHQDSQTLLAKKMINLARYEDQEEEPIKKYLKTEVEAMVRLSQNSIPNIVQYYGSFNHDNHLCIYMEAMDASLFQLLKNVCKTGASGIEERVLGRIIGHMVLALDAMYDRCQIMHRDLKPNNVLLNRCGQVKLCDFGLARILDEFPTHMSSYPGNHHHRAPERFREETKNSYNFKADVWSLGITVFELVTGKNPFRSKKYPSSLILASNQDTFRLGPTLGYSSNVQDFIDQCSKQDPEERATYKQLLALPFIVDNRNEEIVEYLHKFIEGPPFVPEKKEETGKASQASKE